MKLHRYLSGICLLCLACTVQADIVGVRGQTLPGTGDYWYQSFTVGATTGFTLYFAANHTAAAVIFDTARLEAFVSNQPVPFLDGFDASYGIKNIVLAPGEYTVGIRNKSDTATIVSLELETFPLDAQGAVYRDRYISEAAPLQSGERLWQPLTIEAGIRYAIEGLNTGLAYYLIPAAELDYFTTGKTFRYYPAYSTGADTAAPGLAFPDRLPPGDYYMGFINRDTRTHTVVYTVYRFDAPALTAATTAPPLAQSDADPALPVSGLDSLPQLSGNVAYAIYTSDGTISLNTGRIDNTGTGRTGSLQLGLWASASRFDGQTLTGKRLGTLPLQPLEPGGYYLNHTGSVAYRAPDDGTYYLTLTLEEYQGDRFYLVGYANVADPRQFSSTPLAQYAAGQLTLQDVTVGQQHYRVVLSRVPGTTPVRFAVTNATLLPTTAVTGLQYAGKLLVLDAVEVDGRTYYAELVQVGTNPLTFALQVIR